MVCEDDYHFSRKRTYTVHVYGEGSGTIFLLVQTLESYSPSL